MGASKPIKFVQDKMVKLQIEIKITNMVNFLKREF